MTTQVLLIRHGSHGRLGHILCGRMPGVGLSEAGFGEARAVAAAIARRDSLVAVYSSPLERARQTAAPIAEAAGLETIVDDDLDEIDVGAWSGLSFDMLDDDPHWTVWNRFRDHARPPGGETMSEAQVRIARVLEHVSRRHPDAAVALVSHADMIKSALAWTLGLPLAFYARFEISPASVSRIVIGESDAKVWTVNQTYPA